MCAAGERARTCALVCAGCKVPGHPGDGWGRAPVVLAWVAARVSARVSVRERARTAAPHWVGAGCHGNAPRPELIISCGKCAGGVERGGPKRRRGPASRRLAEPGRAPGAAAKPGFCLRQAGELGARLGWARGGCWASARPGDLCAASGPTLPAGSPCPAPPRGAGRTGPETQPSAVL